jgi:hypothetical protein
MEDLHKPTPPRRYPPFWERSVPIFVVIIAFLVVGLAIVAAGIALGIFPWAG